MRQLLRSPAHQRIFGKRDDISPEHEGALAVADRKRPCGVRRRQAGIPDVGDFRGRNEIDRRPAQIGRVGTFAAGGGRPQTGCRSDCARVSRGPRRRSAPAADAHPSAWRARRIAVRPFALGQTQLHKVRLGFAPELAALRSEVALCACPVLSRDKFEPIRLLACLIQRN